MARVRGTVLTVRDRVVIDYLAIARYASTAQLQRLVADGLDPSVMHRRLRKLSSDGNRPGAAAPLRRLPFRREVGQATSVWALTEYGLGLAEASIPYLRPAARTDVGPAFLHHTLMLNEVLLDLVIALRGSAEEPLDRLPLRWLSENDEQLQFSVFRQEVGETRSSVLKPDATVELPQQRRRLFLEAETGAQSVATADPLNSGAILRKLERYVRFQTGLQPGAGPTTFYEAAFPDGFALELLFLVHSAARKARVEASIRDWSRGRGVEDFAVRVLTFGEAAAYVASFLGGAPGTGKPPRTVTIDDHRARQLREGFNAVAGAVSTLRHAILEHNVRCSHRPAVAPPSLDALRELRDLISHDLLGDPGTPNGGG